MSAFDPKRTLRLVTKRNGGFDPKQIVWAYFVLPSLNKEDGERAG
jgi:hypothetical protein